MISDSTTAIILDPKDPKTWWLDHVRHHHDWVKVRAQMHDHCMTLAHVPARKFYYEPQVPVNAMALVAAYYRLDDLSVSLDLYNYEAEALGQRMVYGENSMPTIDFREPLIQEKGDLAGIRPPDWLNAGRVRFIMDVIRLSSQQLGVESGRFCAPFSLAVGLRTYPSLIRDMKRDPQFAHELFTILVDEILPSYLKVQKEYCGVSKTAGADAWSSFPNLTPDLIDEWVVPYATRLIANCQKLGMAVTVNASASYCEERPEMFDKAILFRCFDANRRLSSGKPRLALGSGRWHDYPLEPVLEYLSLYKEQGVRTAVAATVDGRLLRDGPVERIVGTVRRYINSFGRDHDLNIHMANIPADTPSAHVHAAVAAAHTYGRLPIADDLDAVEFQVPERESFQEYVDQMTGGAGLPAR